VSVRTNSRLDRVDLGPPPSVLRASSQASRAATVTPARGTSRCLPPLERPTRQIGRSLRRSISAIVAPQTSSARAPLPARKRSRATSRSGQNIRCRSVGSSRAAVIIASTASASTARGRRSVRRVTRSSSLSQGSRVKTPWRVSQRGGQYIALTRRGLSTGPLLRGVPGDLPRKCARLSIQPPTCVRLDWAPRAHPGVHPTGRITPPGHHCDH